MKGVLLPGNRVVQIREFPVPHVGHGQVLIRMRASSICGSDLRAIYREHLGEGPEAYQNVIAGHEPSGEVIAVGPGCKRLTAGDRVVVYHISGCGVCRDCMHGYFISCSSHLRGAYGWQRDGGHADYLLADEPTCLRLPDELTFVDGALVTCGFGTAYQALRRAAVSGRDSVLVVGLGPVGMAVGMLAKALGARQVTGVDLAASRADIARATGCADDTVLAGAGAAEHLRQVAPEGFNVTVDCSGSAEGRALAVTSATRWGRVLFVGEGPALGDVDVSHHIIHKQLTLMGSWVTSVGHMEELLGLLSTWRLHPERTVTHRFELADAQQAYETADRADAGKVVIVMPAQSQ